MHGCRWSIGNGTCIKVMGEPWLRGQDGAWLPSPHEQGVHNFTVNDLMISNMKLWHREKIESFFLCILLTVLLGMANKPKPVGPARTRTRVNG
jgi:hypothetical protein